MIPRIAKRGRSFKGAGQYYLHDKGKDSKERVAWTHTHNIPTNDPELAMKWMAYTAINKNYLKQQAGVPLTGRKDKGEPVYSFSLAWQPEQEPQKNHMLELAFDALEVLGLKDHESVFVAHRDTAHPHVHVITNLVNPQNGKTLRPQNDRLRFSTWAEAYEKEHGKIYCEERVINNERRANGQKVKHREVKIDHALIIQNLYNQAENGTDFQQSLEAKGYTLAKGDRRGFVLVNEEGKIFSLSAQLKGQRAKDIKARLGDLGELPHGQTLSDDRKHFYRDQYETDRQKKIVDAAIQAEENRKKETEKKTNTPPKPKSPESFASELDKIREQEYEQDKQRFEKEKKLRTFYKREEQQKKIENLKEALKKNLGVSEKERLQTELNNLEKSIADIDKRMLEQGVNPVDPAHRDFTREQPQERKSEAPKSPEKTKEEKREELRRQMRTRNRDRGDDFDRGF